MIERLSGHIHVYISTCRSLINLLGCGHVQIAVVQRSVAIHQF